MCSIQFYSFLIFLDPEWITVTLSQQPVVTLLDKILSQKLSLQYKHLSGVNFPSLL